MELYCSLLAFHCGLGFLLGLTFAIKTKAEAFVLSFDDILTVSGFANLTDPYHHLTFSAYNVFRPKDPTLKDKITEHDLNCAVSSPNALIGSRDNPNPKYRSKGAYFGIANSTEMGEHGLEPYFTLSGFHVKPMDAPKPGTSVFVKGHRVKGQEPLEWHVDFPSGYHLPLLVKMQEYSGDRWEKLEGVEIVADFGEDRLDWEFCLDNLEVKFVKVKDKEIIRQDAKQAALYVPYTQVI